MEAWHDAPFDSMICQNLAFNLYSSNRHTIVNYPLVAADPSTFFEKRVDEFEVAQEALAISCATATYLIEQVIIDRLPSILAFVYFFNSSSLPRSRVDR